MQTGKSFQTRNTPHGHGKKGPVCDGGNHGCTMKGIVAVDAAFRSADLALEGIAIEHIHGINAKTPELTMRNK